MRTSKRETLERRRLNARDWLLFQRGLEERLEECPELKREYEWGLTSNGFGWALLAVSKQPEIAADPMFASALADLESEDVSLLQDEARAKILVAITSIGNFAAETITQESTEEMRCAKSQST